MDFDLFGVLLAAILALYALRIVGGWIFRDPTPEHIYWVALGFLLGAISRHLSFPVWRPVVLALSALTLWPALRAQRRWNGEMPEAGEEGKR